MSLHTLIQLAWSLAIRVIKFKALQLFGTYHFAGTGNLMQEAAKMLRRNCLGWTVVQLHVDMFLQKTAAKS
jgi:hypothetical protein